MKKKAIFITAGLLAALAIGGNIMHNMEARKNEATEQAAKVAQLRLAKEKREALMAEFAANKSALLSDAQRLIHQGEPAAAQKLLVKFAGLQDPETSRLLALATKNASTAQSVKLLSDELANNPAKLRAIAIYTELADLEPSNLLWRALVEENKPIADAMKAQQAKAETAAAREESVKRLFSGWDGSVRSVEEAIKSRLKDPDSYKHVETRFTDPGFGNVTVFTQYRARNSFNAVMTSVATAVVSPTGELVSLNLKN